MDQEFEDISSGVVRSKNGFTVTTRFGGGIVYEEGSERCFIDSEWMGKTNGLVLYRTSPSNKGFAELDIEKASQIFSNIVRALEYQNYKVEVWD